MKSITIRLVIVLLLAMMVQSCSIQKRRYNRGFHVSWFSGNGSSKLVNEKNTEKIEPAQAESETAESTHAPHVDLNTGKLESHSVQKEDQKKIKLADKEEKTRLNSISGLAPDSSTCDLIYLQNKERIEAKVTEASKKEIRYKLCDDKDGSEYTIDVKDIRKIEYSGGLVTVYQESEDAQDEVQKDKKSSKRSEEQSAPMLSIWSIISVVTGFFGIVLGVFNYEFYLLGVIAVLAGYIALALINKSPEKFNGEHMAKWGRVLGFISIILYLIASA